MKNIFKKIFSRATLVIIAILLQLAISLLLPYIINHFYPIMFGKYYLPIDIIINVVAFILLLYLINSDMLIEGRLTWCIILLLVPIFGIIVYFVFVRRKPPRMHKKFYEKVRAEIKQYEVKYSQEDDYLKQNLG